MAEAERYAFGPFTLDAAQHLLLRDEEVVPLPPKAVEMLLVLVRNAGRMVSHDDLRARLWPDTWVSDNTLYQKIWLLRKALETPGGAPCIDTHSRLGYRFVARVRRLADSMAATFSGPCWISLGQREKFPLREGGNVLGRGADCDVVLDLVSVSRRHARITVREEGAMLADLESKNGTFLNDERLREEASLSPGDRIRLGQIQLVFHSGRQEDTVETSA